MKRIHALNSRCITRKKTSRRGSQCWVRDFYFIFIFLFCIIVVGCVNAVVSKAQNDSSRLLNFNVYC